MSRVKLGRAFITEHHTLKESKTTEQPPSSITTMTTEEKATKAKAKPKTRKPKTHPKYEKMIAEAIIDSKSRTGISRQAIKKYIAHKYPTIPENVLTVQLRLQLRYAGFKTIVLADCKRCHRKSSIFFGSNDFFFLSRLVANGHLIQTKGSYRLSPKIKEQILKGHKTKKPRAKSAEGEKPKKKKAPAEGGVKKTTKKAATKPKKKATPKKSKKAAGMLKSALFISSFRIALLALHFSFTHSF